MSLPLARRAGYSVARMTLPNDSTSSSRTWRFAIDTGGTFTDCLALAPDGRWHRAKVLSSGAIRGLIVRAIDEYTVQLDPSIPGFDNLFTGYTLRILSSGEAIRIARYDGDTRIAALETRLASSLAAGELIELSAEEEAPILAARLVTRTPLDEPLPPLDMRLGTTRGTNALLELAGGPIALFITQGFSDQLAIGDQTRPDLFAKRIIRPEPLPERIIEVRERLDAKGGVIHPLDPASALDAARMCLEAGIQHAAIAFIHAWRNPDHEERFAAMLRDVGFAHVSTSSALSRTIKFLPRASASCINAYLAPVFERYLASVREAMRRGRLHLMTSAGGLMPASRFQPSDSLLSGPAGGVRGVASIAQREDAGPVIGFDMGGTSTDVCRSDGTLTYRYETVVADARLSAPSVAIETVAAGGGSICEFRDGHLRVGPRSAGASPGPACYGAGGPLTITDVNLLLGRLDPDRFGLPMNVDAAEQALERVMHDVERATGRSPERGPLLEGLLTLADEAMAGAIRQVSIRQGYDPAAHALVAFGGAAGQHACRVAEQLGMSRVLFPRDASILSAVGLMHAPIERQAEKQILQPLDSFRGSLESTFRTLIEDATAALRDDGALVSDGVSIRRLLSLRLIGQDATIELADDEIENPDASFRARYEALYGHEPPQRGIEVESMRVVVAAKTTIEPERIERHSSDDPPDPLGTQRVWMAGAWHEAPVFDRALLPIGWSHAGPALVVSAMTVTVIEPGWRAALRESGTLAAERVRSETTFSAEVRDELIETELFANRFTTIAEEAGRLLERTALSTNVKERRDFSLALLDADGALLVNAPHIPVHLGALGACARAVREVVDIQPGDVIITNHPAYGGSHLPDVTIITPVDTEGGERLGYIASRAHHAEIGGRRPGSMPADATTLAEEGIVISPRRLIAGGASHFDEVEELLRAGPFPSRAVEENLADLRAAVAANRHAAAMLLALAGQVGVPVIREQMRALRTRAGELARTALKRMPDLDRTEIETLDDGTIIRLRVQSAGETVRIDFTGSASVHPGNLNATPAIVGSAVMYVLRLLIGEALPLNEGLLDAVTIAIPRVSLLDPIFPDDPREAPAVVGGNVETSQRLVNALLRAFGVMADSQGTMNNVVFGSNRFGYYETIGGGCGAGADFNGSSGVHSHMTNTRITDVEVLEHRYPVRLDRFAIRRDSGGAGEHCGGDGLIRVMTMLAPVSLSVLSQHRTEGPGGMHGGQAGAPGKQWIDRADGSREKLDSLASAELEAGDRFTIETPGGGGWGGIQSP